MRRLIAVGVVVFATILGSPAGADVLIGVAGPMTGKDASVQLVAGNVLATEEFGLIAGPAAEGALFVFGADPRENAQAATVVEQFRASGFEPEGYTLFAYGAVQAWAQAAEKSGSLELDAMIASLRKNQFDTVLGSIDFDGKGDLTVQSAIWYVWRGGKYMPLE